MATPTPTAAPPRPRVGTFSGSNPVVLSPGWILRVRNTGQAPTFTVTDHDGAQYTTQGLAGTMTYWNGSAAVAVPQPPDHWDFDGDAVAQVVCSVALPWELQQGSVT